MSVFNIKDQRASENETFCDVVLEIDNGDWKSLGMQNHVDNMTEWLETSSVYAAIMTACGFKGKVTMYLYSPGAVTENHNKLVMVHPGLKEHSLSGNELPKGLYSPF